MAQRFLAPLATRLMMLKIFIDHKAGEIIRLVVFVCLFVCACEFVRATLCIISMVQDYLTIQVAVAQCRSVVYNVVQDSCTNEVVHNVASALTNLHTETGIWK